MLKELTNAQAYVDKLLLDKRVRKQKIFKHNKRLKQIKIQMKLTSSSSSLFEISSLLCFP